MDEIDQIQIQINIEFPTFVSAKSISDIAHLTEEAIFNVELNVLEYLRKWYPEISQTIYDAALHRLHRKAGSAFLIKEAHSGSIILDGIAAGLALWILDKTLGETIKEAWLESDLHPRIKNILRTRFDGKSKLLAESIGKKLGENGIESKIEITEDSVVAHITPKEDEELANELQRESQSRAS